MVSEKIIPSGRYILHIIGIGMQLLEILEVHVALNAPLIILLWPLPLGGEEIGDPPPAFLDLSLGGHRDCPVLSTVFLLSDLLENLDLLLLNMTATLPMLKIKFVLLS